jgi:serine/threonine-protein kinase
MNDPHDPNRTVDVPSTPADSLDAGLAAGFGVPRQTPRSSLEASQRPLLLKEAQGESAHVVKPSSDAMPSPEQTGDRYQLQGEIARGGMGAVLRGRDVDLGRDLAVKVLLEKHAHRPEVVRRFIEEAQIGGQLQHPGVVPVYDVGRFGDRPFFTMKLVKGHTLAALLAERADPSQDRPRFLGIALQVCQAMAYAHAKGVIHRDLKPANIMVGAFGEVQVMDWGLAKVLLEGGIADEEWASRGRQSPVEGTQIRTARSSGSAGKFGTQTEAGSLLGTPAYMPPEQANGDVSLLDRRADVFGLGAILCEILTGKPPYIGRSPEEVRRKAANGDLADALARLEACGADADLILLTRACLSPEAVDRPKDAQAVADGLTAYLDGVQERLHQAELSEAEAKARAVEESKRRRLTLALAATVLLAVTLGGGCWLWVKNDRDTRQAALTREVNDALNRATSLREQARAAPIGSATLFAQAREQAQRALALVENGPADAALVAQVRQLQAELDEQEKDRKLLAALDDAHLAQAESASGKNRFASERAVPLFREAFRAYGLAVGAGEPKQAAAFIQSRSTAPREALIAAVDEWIDLAVSPRFKTPEPHLDWLQAVARTTEPDDGWTRQFRAARGEKDEAQRRAALEKLAAAADVQKLPVRTLTRLAVRLLEVQANPAAIRLLRRTREVYPADFWVNNTLVQALAEDTPPQFAEALRFATVAVALRPDSAAVLGNLGAALGQNGRNVEAIACSRKAIELDPTYANAHNNLGAQLLRKGDLDEAITSIRQAIALDPKSPRFLYNLGMVLEEKGQLDEAIACFRQAVALSPKESRCHGELGKALTSKGQLDEAIAALRQAIALDPAVPGQHTNLGIALARMGRPDEAAASHRKAIELDPHLAPAHLNLGSLLYQFKKDHDAAITCFRKAIELDPKFALAHHNLGNVLKYKGVADEAIASYRKAIALNPQSAPFHCSLGASLCDCKEDYDGAIVCFRKAIRLDPKFARAHASLGYALERKGLLDEAIASYRQASVVEPRNPQWLTYLGEALSHQGQFDAAISCYRKAIALDPKFASSHNSLGALLCDRKGDYDGAVACFRKALALEPKVAHFHANLGEALRNKGLLDEAIASFRRASELDPRNLPFQMKLGLTLSRTGKHEEAIASYRKAIALDPNLAPVYLYLGNALKALDRQEAAIACFKKAIQLDATLAGAHFELAEELKSKGQIDAAISSYKKAIEFAPSFAEAHCNLGHALRSQCRFAESLTALERGHELGTKLPGWPYPSAEWVRLARAMTALEGKLAAFQKGEFHPKDTIERLALASICAAKQLHASAARLHAEAFAADPRVADDLKVSYRYNAACCAALGAASRSEGAVKLDDKERARLHKQALDWLKADLALRARQLQTDKPADRNAVQQALRHWQQDSDLAGIRDKAALAKLPSEEQKAFAHLWADVAALRKKAEGNTK